MTQLVKAKLSEMTLLFQSFTKAHDAYNAALVEESQRQESYVYFADIKSSLNFLRHTVNDWLCLTEASLQDKEITLDNSAFQLGYGNRNKSKQSECGSRASQFSRTSSISSAGAKEAARIAQL